ncbi:MAG: acyl esterase [Gemmatimonas sp.]
MSDLPITSEAADARYRAEEKRFSVCTLVTDWPQYEAMLATFAKGGFRAPDTEFLHIDNRASNAYDGFSGLNLFLNTARGRYVILCHQDVRLLDDGIAALEARIADVEQRAPNWAVLGNAGGVAPGRVFVRITDPHYPDLRRGTFPARATALDENFLVVRRSANLALSGDLGGFHLYATDLCTVADILGYSSWVIDFHLMHLSPGNVDDRFHAIRRKLLAKYRRAFRPRWVVTPCAHMFLTASRWLSLALNTGWGRKMARRWERLRTR